MTLSARRLNRALLARQLLLERRRMPLVRAVERIGGLQAQYAPSAYIGLWSRLDGFALADLTRALERRRLVQATLMRSTIHIVSAADYWPMAVGIRRERREWWARGHRKLLGDVDLERASRLVQRALGDGPRRRDELIDVVRPLAPASASGVWNGVTLDLVRVPPSGTWERRRADLFATAASWLGEPDVDEAAGLDHLLRRYLGAFGPARLVDAAEWAGVRPTALKPSAERLELRRFEAEDGTELLDVPRAPLPSEDVPAPVRFLPTWDATLLVHARRTQILPERLRPHVFDVKTPHSVATFLVDGAVAGAWKVERVREKATLVLEAFEPLPRAARVELRDEGESLVRLVEPDAVSYAVRY